MFFHNMDIPSLIHECLLLYLLTQEAASVTVMVYYAAVQERGTAVHFNQPSPPASVAFIDDISMAFWESVNCVLFHGWADGVQRA